MLQHFGCDPQLFTLKPHIYPTSNLLKVNDVDNEINKTLRIKMTQEL